MIQRPPKPQKPVPTWTGPKPKLAIQHIPVYRVHYEDLQDYLLTVFKMDCDVMFIQGITHGMCPEFYVTGEMPAAWNAQQQSDDIRRGRTCRSLSLILNVLCHDGFIPQGKYILNTRERQKPIHRYRELLQEFKNPTHPKCLALKERNRKDKCFRQQVTLMDRAVRAYTKEENS